MPSQGASSPVRPAIYSSVNVFEQVCRGVPVMRRAKDAYINATQILRAAGLPKTQRTKILERDVCTGMHEKVQGGYHMFQGTWIPLNSAVILSRDHGLEAALSPLFKFEPPESTAAIFADILAERKAAKVGGGLAGPSTNIVSAEPRLSSPTRTSFESTSSSDPADEDREEKDDDDAADEDYAPRKPRPGAASAPHRSLADVSHGAEVSRNSDRFDRQSHRAVRVSPGSSTLNDTVISRPRVGRPPGRPSGRPPGRPSSNSPAGRPPGRPPGRPGRPRGRPPGRSPGRPPKHYLPAGRMTSSSPAPSHRSQPKEDRLPSPLAQVGRTTLSTPTMSADKNKYPSSAPTPSHDPQALMEQDTVELMDPYRVLDPLANSDDDQPPYGLRASSSRTNHEYSVVPVSQHARLSVGPARRARGRGLHPRGYSGRLGRFAPSRRSQPPNLIPQSTADDSTSCSDFALEDSNEDDTFEFADNSSVPQLGKIYGHHLVPAYKVAQEKSFASVADMGKSFVWRAHQYHPYRLGRNLSVIPVNNSVAVSNFNNSGMTHIDSGASGVIRKPAAHGRCAGCDALTVPKWRRDASGRRTLCDACGLKWCFGLAGPWDTDNAAKIGDFSDSVRATNDDRSSKEEAQVSPFNTTKNPSVPFLSSVSTPALTAKSLVSQQGLVEATDGDEQQQLQRLLDEARREDTATDRAFRRAVVRARRARTASASSTTDSIVSSASTASSGTLSAASESAVSSATAAAATAAAAATMASMLTTCRTDGTLSSFSTSKMPAGTIAAAAAPTAPPPSPLPPIPAMHPRVGSRDNAPSQDAAPTWSEDEDWTRHSVLSFINAVRGRQ